MALFLRLVRARHSRHVIVLLSLAVACVVAGGAVFAWTQHIPITTGLYWAITTATTVGYGDVIAHNPAGRLVASAVMLTTIPLLAAVFALVTGAAAAAGVRRVLALVREFPAGTYRVVIGMYPASRPSWTSWSGPGMPSCWSLTSTPARSRTRCT